jgi:dihydroorotate dehydrogenase (NAD+) catalytic subunit
MIKLTNGHKIDFCCASGALGFIGNGYFWEQPFRWFGFLRPEELTVITKTLTYFPRKGNLNYWCPWRCVQPIGGGVVNAVGLTNGGYQWWIDQCYPKIKKLGYKVIVSIAPEKIDEARNMTYDFNQLDSIVGIEINLSCPNVKQDDQVNYLCEVVDEFVKFSRHPTIVKLGIQLPYVEICRRLEGRVEAFDLINSVPWKTVFPNKKSPLIPYGLIGAASGKCIKQYAREALREVKKAGIKTPIISGGGIDCYGEVEYRINQLKADAISFGTIFMSQPWLPNSVAKAWREYHGEV